MGEKSWLIYSYPWSHSDLTCCFILSQTISFDHLYGPSKGGDESSNIKHDTSWLPQVNEVSGSKGTSAESPTDGGSRECAKHKNCASLGGNCCPSDDGIMLECCAWVLCMLGLNFLIKELKQFISRDTISGGEWRWRMPGVPSFLEEAKSELLGTNEQYYMGLCNVVKCKFLIH